MSMGLLAFVPFIQEQTAGGTLTIFAAASLTDAFTEMRDTFEMTYPNADLTFSFGGSSTLATQIIQGAPADVFASANRVQMLRVQDEGLVAGHPRTFARNRLVLIVPSDNPVNIQRLADLAQPNIRLVLAAPGVPVREYTDRFIAQLALQHDGDTFYEAILRNLVSEEDNVRRVVVKVTLGEADAGIVYASDVTPDVADQVITIPIPDALNTIASYPIAMIHDSRNPNLAHLFIDFVRSEAGVAILTRWGLLSPYILKTPLRYDMD